MAIRLYKDCIKRFSYYILNIKTIYFLNITKHFFQIIQNAIANTTAMMAFAETIKDMDSVTTSNLAIT